MVDRVIKLPPHCYLHILDSNTNVTRLVCGPQRVTCLSHEVVTLGETKMHVIPPQHYALIEDPVVRQKSADDNNAHNGMAPAKLDKDGQAVLQYGLTEVRLADQPPFALYPGERLVKIEKLRFVQQHRALLLSAPRDFVDHTCNDKPRKAGEEWLFYGPGTYFPSDAQIEREVQAEVLDTNEGLHLMAKRDCTDVNGNKRLAGESWMIRERGAYLPRVEESIVRRVKASVLTPQVALSLRARQNFTDVYGKERRAGDMWLVTHTDAPTHLQDVHEEFISHVNLTVLTAQQYCVINDPCDDQGKPQLGRKKLVNGPATFFLQPGEKGGVVQNCHLLGASRALVVRAVESFQDGTTKRRAGDKWFVFGPTSYTPPVEARVVRTVRAVFAIPALNFYVFPTPRFFLFLLFIAAFLVFYLFGGFFESSSIEPLEGEADPSKNVAQSTVASEL